MHTPVPLSWPVALLPLPMLIELYGFTNIGGEFPLLANSSPFEMKAWSGFSLKIGSHHLYVKRRV